MILHSSEKILLSTVRFVIVLTITSASLFVFSSSLNAAEIVQYENPYGILEEDFTRVGGCIGNSEFSSFRECVQNCKSRDFSCLMFEECKAGASTCIKYPIYTPDPGDMCTGFCATTYPSRAWADHYESYQQENREPEFYRGKTCEEYFDYNDCLTRCDEKTNSCASYGGPCNYFCEWYQWAEGTYPEKSPIAEEPVVAPEPEKACEPQFCKDDVFYHDLVIDPETGDCVYFEFTCGDGCNAEGTECRRYDSVIDSVKFQAAKPLIHNGRHSIKVNGNVRFASPEKVPQHRKLPVKVEGVFLLGGKEYPLGKSGIRITQAAAGSDGKLGLTLHSEKPMPTDLDPEGLGLRIWLADLPDQSFDVPIVWPGPKVRILNLNKPEVWQKSYGTFEVVVEDPDNNIEAYVLRSKHGHFRTFGFDWDDLEQKIVYAISLPEKMRNRLKFGWMAPELSENMKLDLVRDLRKEFMEKFVKEGIKLTVNEAASKGLTLGFGKAAGGLAPDIGAMMDFETLEERDAAIKQQMSRYYLMTIPGATYAQDVSDAIDESQQVYSDVKTHTGQQSSEMGDSFEKGASNTELALRGGSILLDGIRLKDGVQTLMLKLTGQDTPFLVQLAGHAEKATIGMAQKTLENMADTMKAGRADRKRLPFRIHATVVDKDGYRSHGKAIVWVEGYESLIQ